MNTRLTTKQEARIELILSEWQHRGIGHCNCGDEMEHAPTCNRTRMRVAARAVMLHDARVTDAGKAQQFTKSARKKKKAAKQKAEAIGNAARIAAVKAARARKQGAGA